MKGISWVFLLFAVAFGGAAVGIFWGFMVPDWNDAALARIGTPVTATMSDEPTTNLEVNGIPYYKINFKYEWPVDSGKYKYGSTNSAYRYSEAAQIYDNGNGTIEIAVSVSGKAVALNYRHTPGNGFFWIFIVAFGGVGIGMSIAFTVSLIRGVKATVTKTATVLNQKHIEGTYRPESSVNIPQTSSPSKFEGSVNPSHNPTNSSAQFYNKVLWEIRNCGTLSEMDRVLMQYNSQLDSESFYKLRDEIEKLRQKRKL